MTNSEIEEFDFNASGVSEWADKSDRNRNWPVVYTIFDGQDLYVGETTSASSRMFQHLSDPTKTHLKKTNVIFNDKFNKSSCHDLESHLIRYFHADGKYRVINRNAGITDANYFDREAYRDSFNEIFEALLNGGHLQRSIPELVNSDFFRYSPFKALTQDQALAVDYALETLLDSPTDTTIVIQGDPGTGKTIVAVYLLKLLRDIGMSSPVEVRDMDSIFSDFFQEGYRDEVANMRLGLVIPQLSLRETLKRVFKRTPGLEEVSVMDPFEVGKSHDRFDLLVVDEAHRLQRRNNQSSAMRNKQFGEINAALFGADDLQKTQLDWIKAKSLNQIFLLDKNQSIKPGDISGATVDSLVDKAHLDSTLFKLVSQMRVQGGEDYINYVSDVFKQVPGLTKKTFGNYDLRFFDSFNVMKNAIEEREHELGLSRLVAGYAWPWLSKRNRHSFDFTLEDNQLKWNGTDKDWINSQNSVNEVGSIHTVQGYDLNYAGVIIGEDIRFDASTKRITFHRENYFDAKGKEDNPRLGIWFSDEDLLEYVKSIYRVLMTRGVKGTYVYVCNPELREYLRKYF